MHDLDRALEQGARFIWWPTRDSHDNAAALALPKIHDTALDLIAQYPRVVVATGHLALEPALRLATTAHERGLSVIATHPLNANVGVGLVGLAELAMAGAVIELDAYGLDTLPQSEQVTAVQALAALDVPVIVSSDGGQLRNGDPFAFLAQMIDRLMAAGIPAQTLDGWLDSTTALLRETARH